MGQVRGEDHPAAKLTVDDVREVRHLHQWGFPVRAVAEAYGVTSGYVTMVAHRQTWADVP